MGRTGALSLAAALLVGPCLTLGAVELPVVDNFDIRLSDDKEAVTALQSHLAAHALQGDAAGQLDLSMEAARRALFDQVPGLVILDAVETGAPEVVGVGRGRARLTAPSDAPGGDTARDWLASHSWLFGLSPAQVAALDTDASYTNPAGNISWVRLKQRLGDLDVFRGTITLALTPAGEVARTTGQLAAGLPEALGTPVPALAASEAVVAAAAALGVDLSPTDLVPVEGPPTATRAMFEAGPFNRPVEAELLYFPLGRGAVEVAWSMTLWGDRDSYWVIVSAEDGFLLWRKNIMEEDTYHYSVYPSDSPAPLSPGGNDPTSPVVGTMVSRVTEDVEGQNVHNDPWLPPGLSDPAKVTDGNNVEAGLDIASPDGVDAPVPASSPSTNTFSYSYNPSPGSPPPGDDPTGTSYRNGSVVNLFYWTNRFHDITYDLGFTEEAFNFQHDNYGRGGLGNDRVSAEGQDSSGTNNANFSTPADGGRGRMQMYRWTLTNPGRDGDLDADIMLHELTHGLSNRLHGNASGLGSNMSRCMGEGWSDFVAQSILSEASDPLNACYAMSGWATAGLSPDSYYYGIRGFPKAVLSHTGGPSNLPHNPLTFADVDQTQFVTNDGAFPRLVASHISTTADQVHAGGEVWSSILWEARGQLIGSLGQTAGNQTMLQLVVDGMKLDPLNPTFVDSRDSILAADCIANGGANELDLWAGFAMRGIGYSAQVITPGSGGGTARVSEAFDGVSSVPMDDTTLIGSSCTGPSLGGSPPNPGETVTISVPLVNPFCGTNVTNVTARIGNGPVVNYGTLNPGQTVTHDLLYTIPQSTTCGSLLVLDVHIHSSIGSSTEQIELQVGPTNVVETTFSNAAQVNIPAGAPSSTSGPASPYPSTIMVSGITDPVLGVTVTLDQLSHEWVGDVDVLLEAPNGQTMIVLSDAWSSSNDPPVVATLKLMDAAVDTPPSSGIPPAGYSEFKPVNQGSGDVFDAPAPAGPYADPPLAGFAGIDPNGEWKLWIDDDAGSDPGYLLGGWSIGILTQGVVECGVCPLVFEDDFESGTTSAWSSATP